MSIHYAITIHYGFEWNSAHIFVVVCERVEDSIQSGDFFLSLSLFKHLFSHHSRNPAPLHAAALKHSGCSSVHQKKIIPALTLEQIFCFLSFLLVVVMLVQLCDSFPSL